MQAISEIFVLLGVGVGVGQPYGPKMTIRVIAHSEKFLYSETQRNFQL